MKLYAKKPGHCPSCQRSIVVGELIEWEKGQPTRHFRCPPPPECPVCGRQHAPMGVECDGDDDPFWHRGDW